MYIHLTFHDGSNPFIAYNKSADAVKRIYKQWSRGNRMPLEYLARIDVFSSAVDGLRLYTVSGGGFMVAWNDAHKVQHFSKHYERFGNAVNALGKMSARMQKTN